MRGITTVSAGSCRNAGDQSSSGTRKRGTCCKPVVTQMFWWLVAPPSLGLSQNCSVSVAQYRSGFLLPDVLACVSPSWLVLVGLVAGEQIALWMLSPDQGVTLGDNFAVFLHVRGQGSNCSCLGTCHIPASMSSQLPPLPALLWGAAWVTPAALLVVERTSRTPSWRPPRKSTRTSKTEAWIWTLQNRAYSTNRQPRRGGG